RESTSSIVDSGLPPDLEGLPQRQVTILDVTGKREVIIASASSATQPTASPDGLHIAFLTRAGWLPPNPKPGPVHNWTLIAGDASGPYQLTIMTTSGRIAAPQVKVAKFVAPGSFQWSRNGHEFAFIGI